MKWSYFFKLWITTLLLGSLIMLIYQIIFLNFTSWSEAGGLYIFNVFWSTAFSIPMFLIIAIIFFYLDFKKVEIKIARLIIISATVLGIILTLLLRAKELNSSIFVVLLIYSLSAIISGMIFKLKRKEPENISNL